MGTTPIAGVQSCPEFDPAMRRGHECGRSQLTASREIIHSSPFPFSLCRTPTHFISFIAPKCAEWVSQGYPPLPSHTFSAATRVHCHQSRYILSRHIPGLIDKGFRLTGGPVLP